MNEYDECLACGHTARSIDPQDLCPAREPPSAVDRRAVDAEADDEQEVLL